MTAARHRRKLHGPSAWRLVLAAVTIGAWTGALVLPAEAAQTAYVVVDRNSGLAIDGFDPVAYFIDGAPTLGKGTYELTAAGAVWRFRNVGNRAAFAANPEIYMPRFGGYDPVAIGRGVGVAGNPRYWLITGERLYLFHAAGSRAAFAAAAASLAATADRKWPQVQRTLAH